jgi:hypothetical protein
MSLLDYFGQEYVRGKVVDKYNLKNGNIGLIIDDYSSHKRYHVEFKDGYKGPSAENLFGIMKEPFSEKTEYLDKLIDKDDSVELTVSYSKGPFRQAYRLYSVSRAAAYSRPQNLNPTPYRRIRALSYH